MLYACNVTETPHPDTASNAPKSSRFLRRAAVASRRLNLFFWLEILCYIALALMVGGDRDGRAAMGFFVGLLGAFGVLRWLSIRSHFGAVEPQLERKVESFADEAIVHILP